MQTVDQFFRSFLVGLAADIPGDQPCKFCGARARTGIGHFLEAKVEGIGRMAVSSSVRSGAFASLFRCVKWRVKSVH
jgi:hypothetical protein